jgi:hypothetical protein
VAAHAGVSVPSTIDFDVVERVPGGPTTAFAAPECRRPFPQVTAEAERANLTQAAARRLVGLVTGRPVGRLTRGAQRLDQALRGPADRLACPRACLGDAGPGRRAHQDPIRLDHQDARCRLLWRFV